MRGYLENIQYKANKVGSLSHKRLGLIIINKIKRQIVEVAG